MRKVVRGGSYYSGSYYNGSWDLRTAVRYRNVPENRGRGDGFRLVRIGRKKL